MATSKLQHFLMHYLWIVIAVLIVSIISYNYYTWTAYQNDTQPYAEISCGTPPVHKVNTDTTFLAANSYDVDEDRLSYRFEFSDGISLTNDKPTITRKFSNVGVYSVTLTVTDEHGKEDSHSCDFIINTDPRNPFPD